MSEIIEPLVLDFVEWIARRPRSYTEAMEAWRTSCPRLMVWEEAASRGLVARRLVPGQGAMMMATASGQRLLQQLGRQPDA